MRRRPVAVMGLVLFLVGCGNLTHAATKGYRAPRALAPAHGAPPWPAPPDPMRLTRLAGLTPERREFLAYHVHAHLDVFVNGRAIEVPAGIGNNIADPAVQHGRSAQGDSYGGINLCARLCISPLHTHDTSGVLHTESQRSRPNHLGQFFREWAVRLTASCVGGYCRPATSIAVFVDGKRYTGDPRTIALTDHKEIAIVIGSPPKQIPDSFGF